MALGREIQAKSILTKSGISDFCVNCYVGCTHGCIYCYARFMKRFSGHGEPWGRFLDVKINAPQVLAREVRRRAPAGVFLSSVCDAYQPAEQRYKLTRECLKILVDSGFRAGILTKSRLAVRDFDIMQGRDNCSLGCTLTTADERLRFSIEPGASPTRERIRMLEEACGRGIESWAFLGPFLPGISDTDEALSALVAAIAPLPLSHICADKLNLRPGVWNSIAPYISRNHPQLLRLYQRLFFDTTEYEAYKEDLRARLRVIAESHGVGTTLKPVF